MEWVRLPAKYQPYLRERIKRGHGIGSGREYRPWHGLREGPRSGTAGLPRGIKTGRLHDLNSAAHRSYFFLHERRSDVVDIRERFPILSIGETLELCAAEGVDHPSRGVLPEPLVIDFMITRLVDGKQVYEARDLLASNYSPSLLRVKQAWCERHGATWSAVDTSTLTRDLLDSLIFVRGWFRHRYQPDRQSLERLARDFERVYERHITLKELRDVLARKRKQDRELIHNELLYAMWANFIAIDLRHRVGLDTPLVLYGRE